MKKERPTTLAGSTLCVNTGCGKLYITVNHNKDKAPLECFAVLGKAGGCSSALSEAIGRLVSTSLQYGVPAEALISQLKGISCHLPYGIGDNKVRSCADGIGKALEYKVKGVRLPDEVENKKSAVKGPSTQGACPECGSILEMSEGCKKCHSCGFSECG